MLWFTADLHLGHEAILRFARRPWNNVAEMNAALIANINERVAPTDTLYILGDVSHLVRPDQVARLVGGIACQHVHLIRGNHDAELDEGLFESVRDYAEIRYSGQKLMLMHYPLMTWNGIYRGTLHLHGHIHSRGEDYNARNRAQGYHRYDVGVDANGYRPVSFKEIAAFFKGAPLVTPRRDNARLGVDYAGREDEQAGE